MPVTVIVNNIPIEYPSPGDEPGWGQSATQFAEEVAEILGELFGPNDILQTSFTIANNQSSPANITQLNFNTGTVRAAIIQYTVYRVSTANPSGHAETGTIHLSFDNAASPGSKWSISIGGVTGNSGVNFSITDTGQLQYTSTDIDSVGYSGLMKFRARTLVQ